ncbi:hypothetical protein H5410_036853 [Solanum commersonii]|uniref:Uncharacterized protein n=1 Tax=Solanum commersonii TaxID=4109 RepID=A0A9J5Y624_SOLCO|nr:hypothetical protein H5410_036853 [Solanum commersonii]
MHVFTHRFARIFQSTIVLTQSRSKRSFQGLIVLQNCSATHRLLLFIADLIFSFRAQHTGTLGEVKPFCSFLLSSVHALPQTPNT